MKSRLTLALTALFTTVIGCAPSVTQQEAARAVEGYIEDVNKLFVVDCLLPGQMRKLGTAMTYLSARRPIRTTEADCEVRGGEYVAYDRANYTSALNVWLEKANAGDSTAQLYVGQIYEKGLGRAADFKAAASWYRKAADQGNAQAQINLGQLYEKGLGVPKEPKAALGWYGKAAGLEGAGLMYASAGSAVSGGTHSRPTYDEPTTYVVSVPVRAQPADSAALLNQLQDADKLRNQLQQAQQQLLAQQALLRKSQDELSAVKRQSSTRSTAQPHSDEAQIRAREAELTKQESLLKSRQVEVKRMSEAITAERTKMQRDLAAATRSSTTTPSVSPDADANRIRTLEAELSKKESLLKSKQAEIHRMNDMIDAERANMQREIASAIRQTSTPASAPQSGNENRVRELEAELRQKETLLKTQQAKVSSMSKSVKAERERIHKELDSARNKLAREQKRQEAVSAESTQLDQARQSVTQMESALEAKTETYNKSSAELTTWLTSPAESNDIALRPKIDQRKAELQAQAQEITLLREKLGQESSKVAELERQGPLHIAQAGPQIEIIQPQVLLTRGIPTLQISPDLKELLGRVNSSDGLKSLTANEKNLTADSAGMFRIPFETDHPSMLQITATDLKNHRTDFNLSLIVESGSTVGIPTARDKSNQKLLFKNVDLGKYYALIIGNSDYKAYPTLKTPLNDVQSVDVLLRERYGFSTKTVINGNRHTIMTALNDIQKRLTDKDNLLIYYAGHGEINPKTQDAYWLPVDAEVNNPANWIPSKAITDLLSIMPAKHIMVVSDSCYSGAMTGSAVAKLPDDIEPEKKEKWLRVMATKKARTVLTSGDVKPVLDEGGEGHSVFAEAFLRVLRGNKGLMEDYELYRAVAEKVATASARIGFKQTPTYAPLQYSGHEGSPFFFLPDS